jgi:hypothetical protein
VIAFGSDETIVSVKRRYRAQVKGKLAAIAVPTPELRRLWNETKGNPDLVLGPIREALRSEGYTDVFLLPAQTKIVGLEKVNRTDAGTEGGAYYAKELEDLIRLTRAHLNDNQSAIVLERLTSKLAELELLTWGR